VTAGDHETAAFSTAARRPVDVGASERPTEPKLPLGQPPPGAPSAGSQALAADSNTSTGKSTLDRAPTRGHTPAQIANTDTSARTRPVSRTPTQTANTDTSARTRPVSRTPTQTADAHAPTGNAAESQTSARRPTDGGTPTQNPAGSRTPARTSNAQTSTGSRASARRPADNQARVADPTDSGASARHSAGDESSGARPTGDPTTTTQPDGRQANGVRPIRVLVADAAPMQRSGLRMALAGAADLTIVGEAGDGAEAVDLARRLLPDVVVMDVRMPRLDGLAATRAIADARLPVRVLMLTAVDLDEHVLGAIAAGAVGFLSKEVPAGELVAAIRTVGAGGAIVAPAILARLLARLADALPDPAATAAAPGLDTLTDREREVLVHVARGHTNAEIARALTVSETTIKTHVGHLLTKLGLRDRVQAVVLAYESGLVKPGS